VPPPARAVVQNGTDPVLPGTYDGLYETPPRLSLCSFVVALTTVRSPAARARSLSAAPANIHDRGVALIVRLQP